MEDNPYAVLANMLRQSNNNQLSLYRGKVIKTAPLTIDVAGITLSGNELMVNASILTGDISVGDTVLLLTVDRQLFYVICKVVSV